MDKSKSAEQSSGSGWPQALTGMVTKTAEGTVKFTATLPTGLRRQSSDIDMISAHILPQGIGPIQENQVRVRVKASPSANTQHLVFKIEDLAKNTGLTPTQIRQAEREGKLEARLTDAFETTARIEQAILSSLGKAKTATHIPLTSEMDADCVRIFGRDNKIYYAEIDKLKIALGLTGEQIEEAANKRRLKTPVKGDVSEGTVILMPPAADTLKQMVTNLYAYRNKVMETGISQAQARPPPLDPSRVKVLTRPQPTTPPSTDSLEAGSSVSLDRVWGLEAYVSKSGAIFISNLAIKLGSGTYKDVFKGIRVANNEEVAVAIPRHITPEGQKEGYWNTVLGNLEGMVKSHVSMQLKINSKGEVTENQDVVHITKYMSGGKLSDNLDKLAAQKNDPKTRLQWARNVAFIFKKLAVGMEGAHKKGAILRDIKPDNIMLEFDKDGNVTDAVHTDFGITIHKSDTKATALLGTPLFMAPDLWVNQKVSPSQDYWALATTMYWVLNNSPPLWVMDIDTIFSNRNLRTDQARKTATIEFMKTNDPHWDMDRPDEESSPMAALCWDMLFDSEQFTRDNGAIKSSIKADAVLQDMERRIRPPITATTVYPAPGKSPADPPKPTTPRPTRTLKQGPTTAQRAAASPPKIRPVPRTTAGLPPPHRPPTRPEFPPKPPGSPKR